MVGFHPVGWVQADLQGSVVGPDYLVSFIVTWSKRHSCLVNCCEHQIAGAVDLPELQSCHAEGRRQLREWTSRSLRKFTKSKCLAPMLD